MSSPLSAIPPHKRRLLAATLGLFATLFVAIGAVAATGAHTAALQAFVVVALVVAVVLALLAWGVAHSVRVDAADRALDSAISEIVGSQSGSLCTCGHEHDPGEMHVTGAEVCAHDGSGTDCAHNCDTCVLAALRPSPTQTREERIRGQ
ncbi:MAG TPA: hypothetical protein VFH38_03830 [Jatrophihabitans sp.]|nr:hypothetical protein [Jatrophihabitans sp.]